MKRFKSIFGLSIMCVLFMHFSSFAQLSGNYTINPKNSASTTNYQNWASAASDLISGTRSDGGTAAGPGVSGAVIFTVYDTLYSTQITLSAISGASSANTITFQGTSDSSKCVLSYASGTATTDDWVLKLDGADWITFKKIGFLRTGSDAYYTLVQILGDADHNSFKNCWMKTRKVPSTTTGGWTTGVGTHFFFAGNADTTLIENSRLIYGYNSVYGPNSCYGNTFRNNTFDTFGCIGIYMTQQTGLNIHGNTFNMGDFGTGTGHYVSYASRIESSPAIKITNNKIFLKATNGQVLRGIVLVSVNGSSSLSSLIANNFIVNFGGTSSTSGISLYGVSYMDIYYNNILITSSMAAGSAIHENTSYTQTYTRIINNNLINSGGGMIYDLQSANNAGIDTIDYNNCYTTGSVFGKWQSATGIGSFSSWQTTTSRDANSLNVNPGFVSNLDLHVSNIGINGKATPFWRVSDDIDGDTRNSTTPDIGADEFFPAANDAGISSLDSPSVFCASVKNVKITFQNYGADTLKSLTINWKINNVSQTAYNWTGAIPPGTSSTSIQLGNYNFAANTAYNFKIWGSAPNSGTDGNNSNDTLSVTRYAGMTGSYTIGSTGDFQSINNALSAMTQRGICGAITFNIANGTYQEQLTFPTLPGMGASNPVTFQSASGDSSQVIISLPSSTATGTNNACIQLNGGDYLTFKKITFQRTGTNGTALVVHILNGSDHNSFLNCQMIGTNYAGTSAHNIWSDQGTDNYNTFKNNYVKLGYNSMLFLGTTTGYEYGNVIEGNVFDSAYSSPVQIGYQLDVDVKNNTFLNSRTTASGSYDIQLQECDSFTRVTGNKFYNANTEIAIHLTGCDAPNTTNTGIIANNFIAKTSVTGIYLDLVTNQNIAFNSIYFTGSSSTNAGILTSSNSSSGIILKNNCIYMTAGYVFNIASGSQVYASNRNNLWVRGGQFANWGGTAYSNLTNLRAATSKDANSMSVNPYYVSSTDLHVKNTLLKGAAETVSGITTDIDGQTRNTTTPDIGADEITLQANDAGIVDLTSPAGTICEGTIQVKASLKNFGSSNLTSATINWSVNGVAQTPYNWSGTLGSLSSTEVTLGNYNFTAAANLPIVVRSSSPNTQTDGFQYNDTFSTTRTVNSIPNANAGPDKDLCNGDSVLIGVSQSGNTYKWMTMSGTTIGTTPQIYVNPTSNTSYVFEETKTGGCSDKDTMNVVIRSKPTSGFTINNNSQCLTGNSFVFSNTSSGATTYNWKFGDASTSTATSPSHSYTTAGAFNVKLIAISAYNCKDSVTNALDVRPHPATAFTTNDTTQCFTGNSFVFSNNTSITTGTFTSNWNFGDNTSSTVLAPTKSYTSTGTFAVKLVTTSNYGCKDSITRNEYVYTEPVAAFVINDSSQCLHGNSFGFTDNSTISSGTTTPFWNFGDNTTSTASAPNKTYTIAGTYAVKLITTSNNGCKDSIVKQLMVNPHPITGFMVNNSSQCLNGNSFNFTNLSSGSSGYIWTFGDNTTSTASSPSKSYLADGHFDVKLIAETAYGCMDSTMKPVDVRPHPKTAFTVNNDSQCVNGNSFTFNNTTIISSGTFTDAWDFGDFTTSTVSSPVMTYLNSGTFTVTLVSTSDFGCTDSIKQMVYVHPSPVVSFTTAIDSQCLKGNIFSFDNTSSIASGTFNTMWYFGDGVTSSTVDPDYTYLNAGNYTVTLVATSDMGCTDSVKGDVVVFAQPQAYFVITDQGHCLKGNNFLFTDNTVISGDTISSWSWDFGDGNTDNIQNTAHSYSTTGNFDVLFIVTSSNGCIDSITKTLGVYTDPIAAFLVSDTVVCKNGNNIQFTNNSSGYTGTPSFNWDLGDGNTSTDSIFNHSYATTGSFVVWMKITSAMGCADSATKTILVKANPVVDLGADDTLVDAESKLLDAGSGFAAYLWSNNATTSSITVDSTTFGQGNKTIWVRVTQNGCYGYDTVVITIKKSTSIDDPSSDIALKVYPNPVSDILNVELSPVGKEMTLTLTDMNGKQLKSMRIMPANHTTSHQMDVSELSAGMYYLNISNSETVKVTKIMKY